MKNSKTLALICTGGLLLLATPKLNAQILAAWTFENNTVANNNSPTTSSGTGTADSIGMNIYATPNVGVTTDDVNLGKSSDTGANLVADTTNTWRVRGQAGSNGAANGWSSAAPIGAQGAQFFTSTNSLTTGKINVSFDWYATTQGEANLQFKYTTNGGSSWNNLALSLSGSDAGLVSLTNNGSAVNTVTGSYVSDNLLTNGSSAGQDWFTGLTASITDPSALHNSQFGIEMVNASTAGDDVSTQGMALNNTSGNWRFDNISITGVASVPEPNAWILGVLVIAVVIGLRYRAGRQS